VALAPLPPVVASSTSELNAVVNDWVAAWQRQDPQAYFADYHTDFASLYHDSRASWRADRTRSLTKPAKIALSISDFEVAGTDATGTTVRFWLNYQSPTYADRTQKELVLGQDVDGKLRILRELNREVEVQTGARLSAASVATNGQPQAAAPAIATATPIGDPIVIQPDATVTPAASGRDNLNRFVTSWLNAWQHKDLAEYFEHYAPDFKNGPATTEAWREDRTVKITRPAVIQLQLDNMELVKEGNGETVLKLTVTYHSSYYADRTQKELHLQLNQNGGLQIVEEKNLAVEALPLSRLLPSVQVAMQELARSLASNHL
jgi:ketosteroid isomerase-like protein